MDGERVREIWGRARDGGAAPPPDRLRPGVPTFAGVAAARRPEELSGASIVVLGLPWAREARGDARAAADGPAATRRAAAAYTAAMHGGTLPDVDREMVPARRVRVVDYGDAEFAGDDPAALTAAAHERLIDVVAAGAVPLVLGGDPEVATPVLEVLSGRLTGKLGLIALTPRLGLCGPRGHAAGGPWRRAFELGVADALGHRWYTVADVDEVGIDVVAQEALEAATRGTEAVYLSVDVSVLDLPDVEGGGPAGLSVRETLRALRVASRAPLGAADVSGVCGDGPTAEAAARAAVEIVMGLAQQFPDGQGAGAGAP